MQGSWFWVRGSCGRIEGLKGSRIELRAQRLGFRVERATLQGFRALGASCDLQWGLRAQGLRLYMKRLSTSLNLGS